MTPFLQVDEVRTHVVVTVNPTQFYSKRSISCPQMWSPCFMVGRVFLLMMKCLHIKHSRQVHSS